MVTSDISAGRRLGAAIAMGILLLAARPGAHEIAADVTVQMFVKPEGERLRVLVRVPLAALRDIDYPRRPNGDLDLARADQALRGAATLWIVDDLAVYEDDARLPAPRLVDVRASLASDPSFASYDAALAHVTGPALAPDTEFVWNQGLLDLLLEYPIQSDRSKFSIDSRFARIGLRVMTVLRFLPPEGTIRAFEWTGNPGLVRLDPRWHQAALRFVAIGFEHILDGVDHLLFLFCLVIPIRRVGPLIAVVTSFTVAHSITLIASAYDLAPGALWFPPLIEMLIAASILYMALENVVFYVREPHATTAYLHRRWVITFAFGLVHGFGFSFALKETLQFAGSHLLTSLLSFNVGVELGQILVLAVLLPALYAFFRYLVAERIGAILLSALVAHTGWHWMTERWQTLRQFSFEWPAVDAVFLLAAIRWAMLIVAIAGAAWLASVVRRKLLPSSSEG